MADVDPLRRRRRADQVRGGRRTRRRGPARGGRGRRLLGLPVRNRRGAGAPNADDLVIERDGARLFVDPVSLPFLLGSEVDWVEELIGASFKVKNPNAKSSCGCGVSFSV